MEEAIVPANSGNGAIQERQEFSSKALVAVTETASTAVAAQAKAAVEARYIVARSQPRDWDTVRQRLLKHCARPGFADAARYSKPVGNKPITGLSIRFAEAAISEMGNLLPETMITYDDDKKRIVKVMLTDLERNVTYQIDVIAEKLVQRKSLKEGQTAVATMVNSEGQKSYTVVATEDDLANKVNAQISKMLRNHALRLLPADIKEECEAAVIQTQRHRDAKDPDAARKAIIDAFTKYSVTVDMLKAYLGHETGQMTPDEMVELRAVGTALKEGHTTFADALEAKQGKKAAPSKAPKTVADLKAAKGKAGAVDNTATDDGVEE